jgi:hypothetical protein
LESVNLLLEESLVRGRGETDQAESIGKGRDNVERAATN